VIELNFAPEVRVEVGWGFVPTSKPTDVKYSSSGAAISSSSDGGFDLLGAEIVGSKVPGTDDIRTGEPGENTSAVLNTFIVGEGHYLSSVSFSYQYIAGYAHNPDGPILSAVLIDAVTKKDVATVYTSPVLNEYAFAPFKGYSPSIQVDATGLKIPNGNVLQLALRFSNRKQNLQILVNKTGFEAKVQWTSALSPQAPAAAPEGPLPTNAAAILRGPLLYGIPLEEKVTVVKTWPTFNNTDVNLNTDSAWNYALVLNKPMEFKLSSSLPKMPFDTSKYPSVIKATARKVTHWTTSASATNEPPPSPIDCAVQTCGPEETIVMVPYGSTNIRMSALPWIKA